MHKPLLPRPRAAGWRGSCPVLGALALAAGLLLGPTAAQAQAAAPQASVTLAPKRAEQAEARAAAERDFQAFARRSLEAHGGTLPEGFPLQVNDLQELQGAQLGPGFEVHTIEPQDLLDPRAELSRMAKPTGTWRFLIQREGRALGLATVQKFNGRWETIAFGAAGLAQDVDALMHAHGNAERSNLRFIRVFQAQSDFLEVRGERDGRARFAPLVSARQSLLLQARAARAGAPADGMSEPAEFIDALRTAVRKNLDSFR
ncbi:MAG: hypothetical protein U1E77_10220 [Inhella sp.]